MDILSTKAVLIGTGIMISIIIMTGVIMAVNQIKEIYGYVDKTDISVVKEFQDVFSTYNGAKMNGVDLVNTIRRFENNNLIVIDYDDSNGIFDSNTQRNIAASPSDLTKTIREAEHIKNLMEAGITYKYETKYNVKVEYTNNNEKMKIIFDKE